MLAAEAGFPAQQVRPDKAESQIQGGVFFLPFHLKPAVQ
jgi:hypothetical protein